jgi:hypothetical protein
LVRQSRLSVMPVTKKESQVLLKMGKTSIWKTFHFHLAQWGRKEIPVDFEIVEV